MTWHWNDPFQWNCLPHVRYRISTLMLIKMGSLKQKCRHFDEIFITGCTGSCHFDNFQCSQWWWFHQNEDISVSVLRQWLGVVQQGAVIWTSIDRISWRHLASSGAHGNAVVWKRSWHYWPFEWIPLIKGPIIQEFLFFPVVSRTDCCKSRQRWREWFHQLYESPDKSARYANLSSQWYSNCLHRPPLLTWFNLIPAWMSNPPPSKEWNEITYRFPWYLGMDE